MKIVALLLSLIVFTLTTVPCCALEGDQAHHELQKEHKYADKNDDCCKGCSPFYTCGACVGFTISSYTKVTFSVWLRPVLHDSVYLPIELAQISFSIWQPPKLS